MPTAAGVLPALDVDVRRHLLPPHGFDRVGLSSHLGWSDEEPDPGASLVKGIRSLRENHSSCSILLAQLEELSRDPESRVLELAIRVLLDDDLVAVTGLDV